MEIAHFRRWLREHRRITIDSCIFNYSIDAHPRYLQFTGLLFESVESGANQAVASTISMAEILVHPYRKYQPKRKDELIVLLSKFPNLEWVPTSLEIAISAAELRAEHGLDTPDALISATALMSQAPAVITNDEAFVRVKGLSVILLDQFT